MARGRKDASKEAARLLEAIAGETVRVTRPKPKAKPKRVVRRKPAAKPRSKFAGAKAKGKIPVPKKASGKAGGRRQVSNKLAVSVARSNEKMSRKLPKAKPKTTRERETMILALAGRDTKPRNRTAGEAVRALNERTTKRLVLSDPKIATRVMQKDAFKQALESGPKVAEALQGTPVKGKARDKAIRDMTSGRKGIKKVGPFTRKQLEREGAVRKVVTREQLPSPLRGEKYVRDSAKEREFRKKAKVDSADANALKLLDVAARPFYGAAGAAKAAAEGKDPVKGAVRGLKGDEKSSYRDALKSLGVPSIVADIAGTAADFVLDPVNAVSFGSASVARKAGERAAKEAARRGLSEKAVRQARLLAMRKVEDAGKNRVGLQVKVAGKEVPAVRKVVSRKVDVEREARKRKPLKSAGVQVNPRVRPKAVKESDATMIREAKTEARAQRDQILNETRRYSRSAGLNVKDKDLPRIIDGIEAQDFTKLPPELVTVAGKIDKYLKGMQARREAADLPAKIGGKRTVVVPKVTADPGKAREAVRKAEALLKSRQSQGTRVEREQALRALKSAQRNLRKVQKQHTVQAKANRVAAAEKRRFDEAAEGYFPHMERTSLRGERKDARPGGSGLGKNPGEIKREDLRPLKVQNDEAVKAGRGKVFEDESLPLVVASYGQKQATRISRATFNRRLSEDAPRYKRGEKLRDRDGVFAYKNGELIEVAGKDLKKAAEGRDKRDLFRLDKEEYQRAIDDLTPLERNKLGANYDRANAAWKRLALATPGFYVRNLVGEATMGYMGTAGARGTARYVKASKDSKKVLRRVKERERADLDVFNPKASSLPRSTKTIKVAGKKENLDDFIDRTRDAGILRTGQQGSELRELQDGLGDTLAGRLKKGRNERAVGTRERTIRFAADVEDFWRLASYKAFLDGGMSTEAARRKALDFHFDYGELTKVERQARRFLPFYTFNARALEMHARVALTNPKKLSAVEKTRNTVQDLTGADEDWEEGAREFQRRSVPVVAKIGGRDLMLSAGLPVTLLNEMPLGLLEGAAKLVQGDVKGAAQAAAKDGSEWFLFIAGLTTPFLKAPTEVGLNRSAFFRDDIEREGFRLVPAPAYLAPLKDTALGELLGLGTITDSRSGKRTLGYRNRADYLIRQIPGIPALLNGLVSRGVDRRGRDDSLKVASAVTGLKVEPVDKNAAKLERLYDERSRIDTRMGDLRQRGQKETAAYEDLKERRKKLLAEIEGSRVARGDVPKKKASGKKKVKKKDAGFSFGGSSSGGSSSGGSGFSFGGG